MTAVFLSPPNKGDNVLTSETYRVAMSLANYILEVVHSDRCQKRNMVLIWNTNYGYMPKHMEHSEISPSLYCI